MSQKFTAVLFLAFLLVSCTIKPVSFPDQHKKSKLDPSKCKFPKAEHYVNDFDDVLDATQESELEKICTDYEKKTTNQLVVATVKDLKPYDNIADFSKDMFNEWEIGRKDKNNGVLIVLCMDCHEVRIATGYGAEKILTNEICDQIIDPGMLDYFKNSDPYGGLKYGIEEVIKKWGKG
jgi:uncharacterized protein